MLADAGALLVAATSANAGIAIPAGDWTIDIGGNVNAYYTKTTFSGNGYTGQGDRNNISTGLLPSAVGIGGKTRQNDLDIAFQFTFFTGINAGPVTGSPTASTTGGVTGESTAGGGNSLNIRQAYMTFGDASWGQIKAGRDLGVFGSDAILSDMTLLGVGVGAGGQGNSTTGRIGSGYVYADWVGQIQYSTPNWNGLQFTVAAREKFNNGQDTGADKSKLGFDGKVTYDFTGDVSGRVWAGFVSQRHENSLAAATKGGQNDSYTSRGYDVGARVAVSDFGLVGYFYDGRGLDTQLLNLLTINSLGGLQMLAGNKSDDKGGYVQATYKIPTGTKLGVSYGRNRTEANNNSYDIENKSWIVGAYHPLTKSLNLVAEYTSQKVDEDRANINLDAKTVSLGAILFF